MHSTNNKEANKHWQLLDKIAPNPKKKIITHENINPSEWVKHFKSIIQAKNVILPNNPLEEGPLDYDITVKEM